VSDDVLESPTAVTGNRHLVRVTFGVALAVVVLDQLSKYLVVTHLKDQPPVKILGSWLQFEYLRNSGAAFSFGTSFTFVFTAIAVAVVVVIVRTSRKLGSLGWAIALGGLLGGAVGNLIDRLFRDPGILRGHVVDFISVPHFAIFNLADSAIVCSAVLMVILALRGIEIDGRRS
jgi:signal peptidase II